jgi:hypothetical protein
MEPRQKSKIESGADAVALYHIIYKHEGFEESAQNLFKLVQQAQKLSPGKKRKLYLDIEGHRFKEGGFDADMLELQNEFLLGFLNSYLSEIHCPLVDETNLKPQANDIPPELILIDGRDEEK